MTVFAGAVDATFAAFGIEAVYTPAGGDPIPVRIIARRPDTIVGFGETRIHAETAIFELRASEVANPQPDDQLTSAARPSWCKASQSGTIRIGWCAYSIRAQPDWAMVNVSSTLTRSFAVVYKSLRYA